MKRHITSLAALALVVSAAAQTLTVSNGTLTYCYPATGDEIPFGDNATLTLDGLTFSLSEYSAMQVVDESPVARNTVCITYDGAAASVYIDGSAAAYVDVTVNGAHVAVTQSPLVSDDVCGEITYILQGSSDNGSFLLNGSYKASVDLNGLTLSNPSGAAIDLQDGKRIALSAKSGTVNSLADGSGSQKAALYCKGHLELKGKGSLTVRGNQAHAISAKEYITVKNLTLTVTAAVKDGINCNQYFAMESGTLDISGTGDDGIQASYKDDTDRQPDDTGSVTVSGGTLVITVADGAAVKGIKADGNIDILGGDITVTSSSDGTWDATKLKTKASACLGADGDITVTSGSLHLTASGSGGKGISCDGIFTLDGGIVDIATSGGMLVYSGGTLSHNYTGSADRIASDYKSSAKGVKADSGLIINGGDITVTTASNNAEGLESKSTLLIAGGKVFVKAYDDGINSSSDLTIAGGDVTVISIVGDGIDSNANMYITGGTVLSLGSGGAEQGLDAADENRCAVYITGGNVLSFGGRNAPVSQTSASQALVSVSAAITASTVVAVSSGADTLVAFTIPAQYTASTSTPRFGPGNGPGGGGWNPGGGSGSGKLLISCPALQSGKSYTVANGTASYTASATYTASVN